MKFFCPQSGLFIQNFLTIIGVTIPRMTTTTMMTTETTKAECKNRKQKTSKTININIKTTTTTIETTTATTATAQQQQQQQHQQQPPQPQPRLMFSFLLFRTGCETIKTRKNLKGSVAAFLPYRPLQLILSLRFARSRKFLSPSPMTNGLGERQRMMKGASSTEKRSSNICLACFIPQSPLIKKDTFETTTPNTKQKHLYSTMSFLLTKPLLTASTSVDTEIRPSRERRSQRETLLGEVGCKLSVIELLTAKPGRWISWAETSWGKWAVGYACCGWSKL